MYVFMRRVRPVFGFGFRVLGGLAHFLRHGILEIDFQGRLVLLIVVVGRLDAPKLFLRLRLHSVLAQRLWRLLGLLVRFGLRLVLLLFQHLLNQVVDLELWAGPFFLGGRTFTGCLHALQQSDLRFLDS